MRHLLASLLLCVGLCAQASVTVTQIRASCGGEVGAVTVQRMPPNDEVWWHHYPVNPGRVLLISGRYAGWSIPFTAYTWCLLVPDIYAGFVVDMGSYASVRMFVVPIVGELETIYVQGLRLDPALNGFTTTDGFEIVLH